MKITIEIDGVKKEISIPLLYDRGELETELRYALDHADGWEKRCGELEQENRAYHEAQAELFTTVSALRDRIHEQDVTIAKYDDENRKLLKERNRLSLALKGAHVVATNYASQIKKLQKQLEEASTAQVHDAGVFLNGNTQVLGEIADLKKRNGELLKELDLVRNCAFLSQDIHSLNKWAVWIHEVAVKHGWWETEDGACDDGERPLPEILMLCVTELAEAMEEYRNGKPLAYVEREAVEPTGLDSVPIVLRYPVKDPSKWKPDEKPEGIAIEMLDCVIRILDWMAHQNVDIDLLMRKKVKFNESRSHRHGGKKA